MGPPVGFRRTGLVQWFWSMTHAALTMHARGDGRHRRGAHLRCDELAEPVGQHVERRHRPVPSSHPQHACFACACLGGWGSVHSHAVPGCSIAAQWHGRSEFVALAGEPAATRCTPPWPLASPTPCAPARVGDQARAVAQPRFWSRMSVRLAVTTSMRRARALEGTRHRPQPLAPRTATRSGHEGCGTRACTGPRQLSTLHIAQPPSAPCPRRGKGGWW